MLCFSYPYSLRVIWICDDVYFINIFEWFKPPIMRLSYLNYLGQFLLYLISEIMCCVAHTSSEYILVFFTESYVTKMWYINLEVKITRSSILAFLLFMCALWMKCTNSLHTFTITLHEFLKSPFGAVIIHIYVLI